MSSIVLGTGNSKIEMESSNKAREKGGKYTVMAAMQWPGTTLEEINRRL